MSLIQLEARATRIIDAINDSSGAPVMFAPPRRITGKRSVAGIVRPSLTPNAATVVSAHDDVVKLGVANAVDTPDAATAVSAQDDIDNVCEVHAVGTPDAATLVSAQDDADNSIFLLGRPPFIWGTEGLCFAHSPPQVWSLHLCQMWTSCNGFCERPVVVLSQCRLRGMSICYR